MGDMHPSPGGIVQGVHLDGQKYRILKIGRFWRVCIAGQIRRESALRNYTPQLSVLFLTVHTNGIVVTIRISTADLIGGAAALPEQMFNTLVPPLCVNDITSAFQQSKPHGRTYYSKK